MIIKIESYNWMGSLAPLLSGWLKVSPVNTTLWQEN